MVTIRSYVAVDDVGKVVNPLIVEGQVHGGIAQGIAQALYEEAVYDDDGNLLTTTLADYLVPSAADLPHFITDRTETPATTNPLGVKGVGEAGTIASTPGGGERHRRRAAAARRRATSRCPARPSGSGGPSRPRAIPAARDQNGGAAMIPAQIRLRPARLAGRGGPRPGRRRRGRQGDRRRAEPAAAAAAAARLPRAAGGHGRARGTARRPRRGRRRCGSARCTTHYELVHDPLIAEHCGLLAEAAGDGRRPGGPAPRHVRRVAGARRPGRGPARGGAGAGRDDDRPGPGRRAGDRARATSSSTT